MWRRKNLRSNLANSRGLVHLSDQDVFVGETLNKSDDYSGVALAAEQTILVAAAIQNAAIRLVTCESVTVKFRSI